MDFLEDEFTEERFKTHTRHFHRMQLRPFECLLFGKYADLLSRVGTATLNAPIYRRGLLARIEFEPASEQTIVVHVPPLNLEGCDDENLLRYINDWNSEEVFYDGSKYMEINIQGLSQAFKTIFKKSIIPDPNRLRFWIGELRED